MIKRLISLIGKKFSNLYYCLSILFLKHSVIYSPLQLDGKKNFTIGKSVSVNYKSWLAAMPLTGENVELVIEDGTVIGHFAHIYSKSKKFTLLSIFLFLCHISLLSLLGCLRPHNNQVYPL